MKVIILAGGGGTRLFPLSRTCFPKQFLKVNGSHSLLAQTIRRFLPLVKPSDIVIVTNKDYVHHVNTELAACNAAGAHVLLEPAARNTAPAIAFAARFCLDELGVSGSEVLFVTPSDHIVWPAEVFAQSVRQAAKLAETGRLVTFGVVPDKPETGYGYIQAGERCGDGYEIASFREKPDQETARAYVAAGYYWNSGNVCLYAGVYAGGIGGACAGNCRNHG